jgi:exonuclease VII small subunit
MACEVEQAAVDQAAADLDEALEQYDHLVDIIAGLTGVLQAAQMALAICMGDSNPLQAQAGSEEKHMFAAMHNAATALRGKLLADR